MSSDTPHLPHMVKSELHSSSGFYVWSCDCGRRGNGRTVAIVKPEDSLRTRGKTLDLALGEVWAVSQRHIDALRGFRIEHDITEVA